MRLIVYDTEATSLTPGQICQLSYLMVEGEEVTGKNYFFSVDEMSEGSFEVHGLSMEALAELSGGLYFEDCAQEIFEDFAKVKLLIGHNVSADDRYLRTEFSRCGLNLPKINTFCTMNYSTGILNMQRKVAIGRPKPPKLEELYTHYGISPEHISEMSGQWFGGGSDKHDARFDTAATWLCVLAATSKGDLRGLL